MTVLKLPLDSITVDPDVLPRHPTDQLVALYVEVQRVVQMPPGKVVVEGDVNWLADGLARMKAAEFLEQPTYPFEVVKGTKEDAIWIAAGANAKHGMPLSSAEKRRAVGNVLQVAEWAKYPDIRIAEQVGCSIPTVTSVRAKLAKEQPDVDPETRLVKSSTGSGAIVEVPKEQISKKPKPDGKPKKKPGAAKKRLVKDALGNPVADFQRQAFEDAVELDILCTLLGGWLKQAEKVKALPSGAGKHLDLEQLADGVQEFRKLVVAARLHCICLECSAAGRLVQSCRCGGQGWFTRAQYNQKVLNVA